MKKKKKNKKLKLAFNIEGEPVEIAETSFSNYFNKRQLVEFDDKFNSLIEAIALSGKDFDDAWKEDIFPVLLNSEAYSNEEDLLNEFLGNWFGKKPATGGGPDHNWLMKNDPSYLNKNVSNFTADKDSNRHDWFMKNDPRYAKNFNLQNKLNNYQGKINQQTEDIKKRFQIAMNNFLQAMHSDAMNQKDGDLYKIANSFYKQIMNASSPVIQNFKRKASFGTPDHSEFNQKMNQHNQNQTQAATQTQASAYQKPNFGNLAANSAPMNRT
jgi:hypothetical protein